MRKLIVTCRCGQRMQVPRSAIGKTGVCPACGQRVRVTARNAVPQSARRKPGFIEGRSSWWRGQEEPSEEAKQRFGEAVDLYYAKRYAEALAIFDVLARQYPGNPVVERGRSQCLNAMERSSLPPLAQGHLLPESQKELNPDTVKDVILDRMINGAQDEIRLKAAELACKILGLFDHRDRHTPLPGSAGDTGEVQDEGATPEEPAPAEDAAAVPGEPGDGDGSASEDEA